MEITGRDDKYVYGYVPKLWVRFPHLFGLLVGVILLADHHLKLNAKDFPEVKSLYWVAVPLF